MGSHTSADLPRIRSLECSIQKPYNRDEDMFLDLKVEFTSKANTTLPILNLGEGFGVDIQHQLVYQIKSVQDETVAQHGEDERRSSEGSVVEHGPYFTTGADERTEGAEGAQEETPRRIYKRGMGISPSPVRKRLFPPSPSSDGSPGSFHFADEDKENKTPEYTENSSVTPPRQRFEMVRDTTVLHLPLSPLDGRGQSKTTIAANEDYMESLSPQPLPSVHVAKREERSSMRPDRQSRIPISTSSDVPDALTSNKFSPKRLIRSRIPKKLSLSPEKPRRPRLWDLDPPNSDSPSGHGHRSEYSSNYNPYWEFDKKEEGGETDVCEDNTTEEEIRSSYTHDWLRQRDEQQESDRDSQIGSPGGAVLRSPPRATKSTTNADTGDQEYQQDEDSMGNIYGPFGSPSLGSISLPSPSTSSKLSMPWNSAEELTAREKVAHSSLFPEQEIESKALPSIGCTGGTISLTFPEDTMDGIFICDATVHLIVASPGPAGQGSVNVRILAAELNKPFGFKLGMQCTSTEKGQDIPHVFLTHAVNDITSHVVVSNKLTEHAHESQLKEPEPDAANNVEQNGPISGEERKPTHAGGSRVDKTTISILDGFYSLWNGGFHLYIHLIIGARRLKCWLIGGSGETHGEHNLLGIIKRMTILLLVLPIILMIVYQHHYSQISGFPTLTNGTRNLTLHSECAENEGAVYEGLGTDKKARRGIRSWILLGQAFDDEISGGSTEASCGEAIVTGAGDDEIQMNVNGDDENPEGYADEDTAESVEGVPFPDLEVLRNENKEILQPAHFYEDNSENSYSSWAAATSENTHEEQASGTLSLRDRIDRFLGWRAPVE